MDFSAGRRDVYGFAGRKPGNNSAAAEKTGAHRLVGDSLSGLLLRAEKAGDKA